MLDAKHKVTDTMGMNKLTPAKRAQALQMMAESISLRAMTRQPHHAD